MSTFSIKWLLLAVAYLAVSIAALLNANVYWRKGLESAAILFLLTAFLGTAFGSGKRRAFWTGCLVFGGAWFLVALGFFELTSAWRKRLVTTAAFEDLHQNMFSPTREVIPQAVYRADHDRLQRLGASVSLGNGGTYLAVYTYPSGANFVNVGNATLGVPFALLGGVIATWFWRKRESSGACNQPNSS